jgi:stage V sporulation protein D (sporulation-specific penicillin-binding protein)
MDNKLFNFRFKVLVYLFFLWGVIILARTFYLGVIKRDDILFLAHKIAKVNGKLPSNRGKILSKDGKVLVASKNSFNLMLQANDVILSIDEEYKLSKIIGPFNIDDSLVLKKNLSVKEVVQLEEIVKSGFPVKIKIISQRVIYPSKAVEYFVGIQQDNIGISGWEKEYDSVLKGTNGQFTVLLDRRRNWIASSFKVLKHKIKGKDVTIPYTLAEIENMYKEKNLLTPNIETTP